MNLPRPFNWIAERFGKFSEFVMSMKKDKWLHVFAGFIIYVAFILILPMETENGLFGASWFVVVFAGAFKEIVIDKWAKLGTPEWNDFYATIAIPTFITALQFLITWIF